MKLLITGAVNWTEDDLDDVRKLGHDIIFIEDESIPLIQQNIQCKDIEGVICNGLFLYNSIENFINLKFIQLTSAGYDRVPLEYIKNYNIKIFNAKDVYSIPMAEFVINGILQLYKYSSFFYENKKKKEWRKCRKILELLNKKICIVGCGNVGKECAKKFKAFDCVVEGVDLYPIQSEYFDFVYDLCELDMLLKRSDVVVLTLPLTNDTENLINKNRLNKMKENSILVNVSRGKIVDQEALIEILNRKQIFGAILDVFENEPLNKESKLWELENVILTPHNSFIGEGNRERLKKYIFNNLYKLE